MAKKQRRRVRDTWKEKSWYTINLQETLNLYTEEP